MSSITPPSFIDDGGSFQKRISRSLHPTHIAKWIDSTRSDTTSAYTGSYIDDGADMLYSSKQGPGFGQIDPHFYKQRKRKEGKKGVWSEDIQKAVAGDIQRSLEKLRSVGNLEVKRHKKDNGVKQSQDGKKKDTVTIPLPRRWGIFVIKAEEGRIIVVNKDGEFDSGPRLPRQQQPAKWIKAPTTIDTPSLPPTSPKRPSSRDKDAKHKDKKHRKHLSLPTKSLTPIQESEYEDGYLLSAGEDLVSPTDFFMTGGANGWPSRLASSVTSPIKAAKSRRSSDSLPLKYISPRGTPPGSWPSPPQTPTMSVTRSSTRSESWGEQKSHRSSASSHSRESGKKDYDNISMKSYSTYKPATVQDVPDTSSENASLLKEVEWGGYQKGSASASAWGGSNTGWGGSQKSSHKSSRHGADDEAWTNSQPACDYHVGTNVQNWVGDRVKTISEASTHKSRRSHRSHRSHVLSEQAWETSAKGSDVSWDGYEKPKTLSEVSVAGTGSERMWPGSHATSRHSQGRRSKASSHYSHRSSRHGAWGGSEQSWGGSQRANVDGWTGDQTESESGDGRYANRYDEDNETYLNEYWGGVPVRVGSRRKSVAGWD